jgi:hypothetical protein
MNSKLRGARSLQGKKREKDAEGGTRGVPVFLASQGLTTAPFHASDSEMNVTC